MIIAQNDSLPYEVYKNKIVLYSDFGYTTAPFSIKYDFNPEINKLKFRNNYKTILGYGICYKWFALRLSFALPGSDKNILKYGNTTAFNLGFDFTFKKFFWDVDFRNYKGYVVKNANNWNSKYSIEEPNEILPQMNSVSFSINSWYFHNKHFKMQAVRGKTAHFTKKVHTWYLKSTFNIYGIGNDLKSIVPNELIDPKNTKTNSNIYSAFDFGMIPGYAYGNRINNWQVTGLFGFGPVIQSKYYNANGTIRSFIGLAPRYDIKFIGGYSEPKYFIFIVTDFDNKTIHFNDLKLRQTFYSIKIVGGYRFDNKDDRKKKKEKKSENI
ncbi:MAG: hypothetical protein HYR91_07115 [Flavobacteriia bacterium]|nr:hypothetical protein [Flavobacteriia bacterium]